ncbi:MAG: PspC domain-containing protein [Actinoallomurus sp.]
MGTEGPVLEQTVPDPALVLEPGDGVDHAPHPGGVLRAAQVVRHALDLEPGPLVLAILSCLLPGPQFVIYIILWLMMPSD